MFVALTLLAPRAPAPACIVMSGKADPLRPQQPPLEPMIINAIQDLLRGKEPDAVVERAVQVPHHATTHCGSPSRHLLHARSHVSMLHVQGRSADPDYELPDSEQRSAATASTPCHCLNPLAAVR